MLTREQPKKQAKQSHIIYDLLNEYRLDNPQLLPSALRRLSRADWASFSDQMEKWYEENPTSREQDASSFTPTTFCFPVLPSSLIDDISSHLLISDKLFLDDPLYDIVALLGYLDEPRQRFLVRLSREKVYEHANRYIQFYLKARNLVGEDRLIPYKESILMPAEPLNRFFGALMAVATSDKRLLRLLGFRYPTILYRLEFQLGYLLWRIRKKRLNQGDFLLNWVPSKRFRESATTTILATPTFTSLAVFALFGGLHGLSTDFISKDLAFLFRKCLQVAEIANRQLPETKRFLVPGAYSRQSFNLPLLCNVPIERVLDTILLEPDAFEAFRASINEKLLDISAPPGSRERDQQIARIQEQIRADIAEISLAYRSAQRHYRRKWAMNLLLGSFSVLVAGLSASTQNLNALAIAGSVASGAGIAASLKELAEEWLEYQLELGKLKIKDNFFVWRLLTKQGLDASK